MPTGAVFDIALTMLHDSPMLAVSDFYHGSFHDFACKPANGAAAGNGDFEFTVTGMFDGVVDTGAHNMSNGPGVEKHRHDDSQLSFKTTTSALYQVNPPSMGDAVVLEALDADGNPIEGVAMSSWE